MKNLVSLFTAGLLAVLVGLTSVVSSNAAPVSAQKVPVVSNVEQVQYVEKRRHDNRRWDRRDDRRWDRRDERRRPHYNNREYRPGYWKNQRGYREHRRGYRRHSDGYWYPLGVFRL